MINIGPMTLGLVLMAVGGALLAESVWGISTSDSLLRYWGAIPLVLGVEVLATWRRARSGAERRRVRLHAPSVAGLALVMIVILTGAFFRPGAFGSPGFWGGWYPHEDRAVVELALRPGPEATILRFASLPGTWRIIGSDEPEISVSANLKAMSSSVDRTRAAAGGAVWRLAADGDAVTVFLEVPGYDGGRLLAVHCVGTIELPRGFSLDLSPEPGRLTVEDIDGNIRVTGTTGEITVRQAGGAVLVGSSTGSVLLTDIGGPADLTTSTGLVRATRVAGDVSVRTSTGAVEVIDPGAGVRVRLATGTCSVSSAHPPAGDWDVVAATGTVACSFPRGSDVTVAAEASSISTNLGFPVTGEGSRRTVRGVMGDGTYMITLSTRSGTARLTGTGD